MKTLILFLAITLTAFTNLFAQCSTTPNDYEIMLVPNANNSVSLQIKYNSITVAGTESFIPKKTTQFDGLVFAMTWPTSSNIEITSCKSTLAPFDIMLDKGINNAGNNVSRVANDNIVTLVHNVSMPTPFGFDWEADKWYTIATVEYKGVLNTGDYFSLLNCDYGLANPNSFSGNSHTDPWLSLISEDFQIYQFSPKMTTKTPNNIAETNKFNIYPNPAVEDLNIDIESQINSQVAINITDLTGKIVKNVVYKLEKGENHTNINIGNLAPGNYFVKITDGKAISYTKQISKM